MFPAMLPWVKSFPFIGFSYQCSRPDKYEWFYPVILSGLMCIKTLWMRITKLFFVYDSDCNYYCKSC